MCQNKYETWWHMASLTKLVVLLIYNVSTECQPKEELHHNCTWLSGESMDNCSPYIELQSSVFPSKSLLN
jgi:hypothetical protein